MALIPRVCLAGSNFQFSSNLNSKYANLSICSYRYPSLKIRNLKFNGVVSCASSVPLFGNNFGRVGVQRREGGLLSMSFGLKSSIAKGKEEGEEGKKDVSQVLNALLPFVVVATALAALMVPSTFTWVTKEMYAPALGGIMLSIGIRLSMEDFAQVVKRPLPLSIGFIAQYLLKPALGVFLARSFGLAPMYYAGFILTSCVAGAQLSSYASFLSKGDVALSILLTSLTTILSAIITPVLTGLLIGSVVPVDGIAMSKSILQVVFLPITLGLVLNTYAKPLVGFIRPVMPFVAMACTSICIGSPLALNRSQIMSPEGLQLVLPVFMFHAVSFAAGYWISKIPILGQEEDVCRTVSLCTGMQSSTIAGLLASQFLGGSHAVPPACSVVAMAIMGLSIGSFWGNGYRFRDILQVLFPEAGSAVKA